MDDDVDGSDERFGVAEWGGGSATRSSDHNHASHPGLIRFSSHSHRSLSSFALSTARCLLVCFLSCNSMILSPMRAVSCSLRGSVISRKGNAMSGVVTLPHAAPIFPFRLVLHALILALNTYPLAFFSSYWTVFSTVQLRPALIFVGIGRSSTYASDARVYNTSSPGPTLVQLNICPDGAILSNRCVTAAVKSFNLLILRVSRLFLLRTCSTSKKYNDLCACEQVSLL